MLLEDSIDKSKLIKFFKLVDKLLELVTRVYHILTRSLYDVDCYEIAHLHENMSKVCI
jgi:hypothetical protein